VLDSETRRKIDTLRDILVGKIPNPQTQVEQITTGLIYKFMNDMDKESIEMGGKGSFFVGDYEKYSWNNLLDPKLSGVEKVKLYSDAIEGMYLNPSAPQLFREMFRNAFLPFKDPSTLNMFLKEINEFHYSHSEKLGDAFEYLISIMGSQGDAGQFRTPRHIIDFIVDIIDPQKNETILDPACGTAGFLISSYKHILENNTDKNLGDQLSAEDKKKVGENITGYDISPEMIRLSLVNMYLHGFSTPKIDEYDTLSSEDKWNEYFDVILANPPFFSPKGGIQPHKRFGVDSKKAEVLFTSYILEHLKPQGRAGIIVPEGIIFQTGTAYKAIRKQLVEKALIGVISLPAGVFQPYSNVKTSILILDKELNQKSDSIFFAKVETDGFSLGAQRTPIQNNDIPHVIKQIRSYLEGKEHSLLSANKQQIQAKDFKFSGGEYEVTQELKTDFDIVELTDVLVGKPIYGSGAKKSDFDGEVRYLRITDITDDGRLKVHDPVSPNIIEPEYFLDFDDFLIARSGSVGRSYLHKQTTTPCQFAGYLIKFPLDKTKVNPNYLSYITKSGQFSDWILRKKKDSTISNINAKEYSQFKFPLPPIEVQQQIVDELEGYQKIIDGCRQVVENYKPTIGIDPSWEMVELGELASLKYGLGESAEEHGTHRFVRITDINEFGLLRRTDKKYVSIDNSQSEYVITKGDVLMARTGATYGKCLYFEDDEPSVFAGYLIKISLIGKVLPKFFWIFSQSGNFDFQKKKLVVGGGQPQFNANTLKRIIVPVPPIEDQERIITEVVLQQKIVEGNFDLMHSFQAKIQDRINKVWGE